MTHTSYPLRMCSPDEAFNLIDEYFTPADTTQEVRVRQSFGQILARPVTAERDVPGFDNSAMDGVVIRKSDWDAGQKTFELSGEIPPELNEPPALKAGTAMRIMTGAAVPEGGDFIIPVEMIEESDGQVTIRDIPGKNPIRKRGEGYRKGTTVLEAGTLIRPYELGLMIEAGVSKCETRKTLVIGVLVTGSEIDESRNTNGPELSELINQWPGVMVREYPAVRDDPTELNQHLLQLRDECDIIVTTGGISAGKSDYLPGILEEENARLLIRKINQKPGKPFTLYDWEGTTVCCLPGNPVSAVFTAEIYLRRIHARLTNYPVHTHQTFLDEDTSLQNAGEKTLFVPGKYYFNNGRIMVKGQASMKSHLLQLYRDTNCYLQIPPESETNPDDFITIFPFT